MREWLIKQQDGWVNQQSSCESDFLLHAPRKLLRVGARERFNSKCPQEAERLFPPLLTDSATSQFNAKGDIAFHSTPWKQAVGLKHVSNRRTLSATEDCYVAFIFVI